jgi:hypothetical protein
MKGVDIMKGANVLLAYDYKYGYEQTCVIGEKCLVPDELREGERFELLFTSFCCFNCCKLSYQRIVGNLHLIVTEREILILQYTD